MFTSGINKERKFERRHYYLSSKLVKKIEELAKKENTTRSKIISKLLKKELGDSFDT